MALSNFSASPRWPWMRSPDMPVWWSGFRSTTDELQREGWEFIVEQDVGYRRQFTFLLRDRRSGQVGYGTIDERDVQLHADLRGEFFDNSVAGRPLVIQTMRSTQNIILRTPGPVYARRVDMESKVEFRDRPLHSYDLFRPWAPEAKDIILPQDSAMELLERLKKLHAPEMAKARERAKMESRSVGETVHAQIISLAA